jgi:hypothetical protein
VNYLPPLRNYQQMVRVLKKESRDEPCTNSNNAYSSHSAQYQLGNAFGDNATTGFDSLFSDGISHTQKQLRTLESMSLPGSTGRRPGQTGNGGAYSGRATSTLFHNLNEFTRNYFSGQNGGKVNSRHDMGSGTKYRTQLSPNADTKIVHQQGNSNDVFADHHAASRDKSVPYNKSASHRTLHPVPSHFPPGYSKAKRHRASSVSDLFLA